MARVAKALSWLIILALLLGAIGAISYFTDGFKGEFKNFYIRIDGKDVLSSAENYRMIVGKPWTVELKYTLIEDAPNTYSVKIIPNQAAGEDLEFYLDGEPCSFFAEKDLSAGFIINRSGSSFQISPKGGSLAAIMSAVYPERALAGLDNVKYPNTFLLVVGSSDAESTVTIAFSVIEIATGIVLSPDHIYF